MVASRFKDLSMPVMNGLDAARVLKRLMPTIPLIMYALQHASALYCGGCGFSGRHFCSCKGAF